MAGAPERRRLRGSCGCSLLGINSRQTPAMSPVRDPSSRYFAGQPRGLVALLRLTTHQTPRIRKGLESYTSRESTMDDCFSIQAACPSVKIAKTPWPSSHTPMAALEARPTGVRSTQLGVQHHHWLATKTPRAALECLDHEWWAKIPTPARQPHNLSVVLTSTTTHVLHGDQTEEGSIDSQLLGRVPYEQEAKARLSVTFCLR